MAIFPGTIFNDNFVGTIFNDTFVGSNGNDRFNGGSGLDIADYSNLRTFFSAPQSITILPRGTILKGSLGTDQLTSVERIIANPFASNNLIDASTADAPSFIDVDLSSSRLTVRNVPFLGTLNFTVNNFDNVIGTSGNDRIIGDFQANILNGSSGNDLISAGGGNDTLVGGAGADTLTGGTGINTFIYNSRFEGVDLITDFVSVDRIHLRSSGFAGLSLGSLSASRYGEGNSLSAAATAAFVAGASSGAAILSVGTAAGVQVWYTNNAFNTAVFGAGANLLATLSSNFTNLATVNQTNFSVIA
jgi:Ca2+-binding RTX toxin-like protein